MEEYDDYLSLDYPSWPDASLIIRANELPPGIYNAKVFSDDVKVFEFRNGTWIFINSIEELTPESSILIVGVYELLEPYKQFRFATLGIDIETMNLPKDRIIRFEVLEGKKYAWILSS